MENFYGVHPKGTDGFNRPKLNEEQQDKQLQQYLNNTFKLDSIKKKYFDDLTKWFFESQSQIKTLLQDIPHDQNTPLTDKEKFLLHERTDISTLVNLKIELVNKLIDKIKFNSLFHEFISKNIVNLKQMVTNMRNNEFIEKFSIQNKINKNLIRNLSPQFFQYCFLNGLDLGAINQKQNKTEEELNLYKSFNNHEGMNIFMMFLAKIYKHEIVDSTKQKDYLITNDDYWINFHINLKGGHSNHFLKKYFMHNNIHGITYFPLSKFTTNANNQIAGLDKNILDLTHAANFFELFINLLDDVISLDVRKNIYGGNFNHRSTHKKTRKKGIRKNKNKNNKSKTRHKLK